MKVVRLKLIHPFIRTLYEYLVNVISRGVYCFGFPSAAKKTHILMRRNKTRSHRIRQNVDVVVGKSCVLEMIRGQDDGSKR
ncbi:hypothetical protein L6452_01599 [Arctium lappa]|uniref:Uncharacterized protein n=1 Tax=Arctium lappa TaxID=4217 RepID=A0ACB9FHX1_ARCLA|nr:hypothetical protein L6452_01599 [Arctium lappa]